MPYRKQAGEALAAWRAALRARDTFNWGTPNYRAADAEVQRTYRAYRKAVELADRKQPIRRWTAEPEG